MTTEKILTKRMIDNKKPLKAVNLIAFNLHSETGLGIKKCMDAYILMKGVTKYGIYDNTLEYLKEVKFIEETYDRFEKNHEWYESFI